ALFAPDRVDFRGVLPAQGVADLLSSGAVYVWPGCGEAYGLAYLEAQAAGLPVVAWATAGVPEVVRDGETGLLVAEGDLAGLTGAVAKLLADTGLRRQMGRAGQARIAAHHTVSVAARQLDSGLKQVLETR
ncbi:MAG TPA: glycosyltransferase, partial [Paenirhodobacter sp.]